MAWKYTRTIIYSRKLQTGALHNLLYFQRPCDANTWCICKDLQGQGCKILNFYAIHQNMVYWATVLFLTLHLRTGAMHLHTRAIHLHSREILCSSTCQASTTTCIFARRVSVWFFFYFSLLKNNNLAGRRHVLCNAV